MGIDPASIRTGYALLVSSRPNGVHECGYLSSNRRDDEPMVRIRTMCVEFGKLVVDLTPDIVCIEISSGHVGANRHKGGGAGLATYGMAVGALWYCMHVHAAEHGYEPWHVAENVWTGGRKKEVRRREVARIVPRYKAAIAKDPGGDVADAIEIAWWAYAKDARLALGVTDDGGRLDLSLGTPARARTRRGRSRVIVPE